MDIKKITFIVVMLLVAVISFTKIAPWAADPNNHVHTLEQTEDKIAKVMTLSGGAAATSATISLLPGDLCTPIAEQLAELAKYFLVILCALYLEKFLVSLSGYIAFSVLIPVACLLVCASIAFGKKQLRTIAGKLAVVGIIYFIIVPFSVWLSDKVYETQAARVENAVEEYEDLQIEGEGETSFFNEFTTITTETVEKVSGFLGSLLESLAVMIVTACVIPVLVFVFLIWLVKTIFTTNVLTLDTDGLKALTDHVKSKE